MADELLERVKREIHERKQAVQAAVEESRRLELALVALGSEPRAGLGAAAPGARGTRRSPPRRARAAPGANREAILALVRDRPGVTAGEIAQATGIPRSTVAPTLSRLTDAGAVERRELPGRGLGFWPARGPIPGAATETDVADTAA